VCECTQRPKATRVTGFYAWNQLGRKVKKGERGILHSCPDHRQPTETTETEDQTKQNGLGRLPRRLCLRVAQTESAELPEHAQFSGDAGTNRDRLIAFINTQGSVANFKWRQVCGRASVVRS
jgi:hypothetical protein